MKRLGILLLLVLSFIVPALFVGAAFAACGVGHGDCRLMFFLPALFPYAVLLSEVFSKDTSMLLVLALGQFPVYVLVLALSRGMARKGLVSVLLLVAHAVAVVFAFRAWVL